MITFATTRTIAPRPGTRLVGLPAAAAPDPTLSDIAGCNEQAAETTGAASVPPAACRDGMRARLSGR